MKMTILLMLAVMIPCGATAHAALIDNGNGTVTDSRTGLIWQQGEPGVMTWGSALSYCEGLDFGGSSSWRLPNIKELESLTDDTRWNPSIDKSKFPNAYASFAYYLSSTSHAYYPDLAWYVSFKSGNVEAYYKNYSFYVRCVRGGQSGSFGNLNPTIAMTPMAAPAGTTFAQGGTGFTPNGTVTLHSRKPDVTEYPTVNLPTDADGNFSITYDAPAETPPGTYIWWAVDDTTGRVSERLGYLITGAASQQAPITPGAVSGTLPPRSVNLAYGELTRQEGFDPDRETFVIVHGWNPSGTSLLPYWVPAMGYDIKHNSTASGSNVLYWNWQEKAVSKWWPDFVEDESCFDMLMVPYDETQNSGIFLASALNRMLPKNYTKNIHFIGHSLGTLVSTYAAKYAKDSGLPFADLIKHLVFLDSPCYAGKPGDIFLNENKDTIFLENYISQVGRPYKDADVNVWLTKAQNANWVLGGHSYPNYWYWSSMTNFSDKGILGDWSKPPGTMPWGFYWQKNSQLAKTKYSQYQGPTSPHYLLYEGSPAEVVWDLTKGVVIDLSGMFVDAYVQTISNLVSYAEVTGNMVTILGMKTFNTAASAADYVTDVGGHAFLEFLDSNGYLTLQHASTAVLSMPTEIPAEANALTFGLGFLYAAPGSMLEVFIDDELVYRTTSDRVLSEGYQLIPWINVGQFSGQLITLQLRLSNETSGSEGKIFIDDLMIAKIEQMAGLVSDDLDHDGLTAEQEADLGTDPELADTDGDGFTDGEEYKRLGTNPLTADTDSDGYGDFIEIMAGSDPLDPDNLPTPPQAADDVATTLEDMPVTIAVLANDVGAMGVTLAVGDVAKLPSHGTAEVSGTEILYTPAENWSGVDNFTYTVSDGVVMGNTAIVSITVTPVDDPPTGTVTINGGAESTRRTSVLLTLSAVDDGSGPIKMCISNTATCRTWGRFAPKKRWYLTKRSGIKTVNVWFRDRQGNKSAFPVSDTILLDRTKPSNGTVTVTPGDAQLTLNWDGFTDEAGSGITGYRAVFLKGRIVPLSCTTGNQIPVVGTATTLVHTGLVNGKAYSYRICAIDAAGNKSSGKTATGKPIP